MLSILKNHIINHHHMSHSYRFYEQDPNQRGNRTECSRTEHRSLERTNDTVQYVLTPTANIF